MIELLVVIAIISILTAILLPALSKAKGKAREMTCTSNMKQIGQMFQLYDADYNDFYPYYQNEYGNYWSNILYALYRSKDGLVYLGPDSTHDNTPMYKEYIGWCNLGCLYEDGTIFHCPAQETSYYPTNADAGKIREYPCSYAMNETLGSTEGTIDAWNAWWKCVKKVKYPSKAMLVIDAGFANVRIYGPAYWRDYTPVPAFMTIHGNRRNVLYCDGHASGMKSTNFPDLSDYNYRGKFWTGTEKN